MTIRQALDTFWDSVLEVEPLVATEIGDKRFDHLLPDLSPSGRRRRQAAGDALAAAVESVRTDDLPTELRLGVALARFIARRQADRVQHRLDLLEAASHQWGPGHVLAEITEIHRVESAADAATLTARLRAIPDYLRCAYDLLTEGAASEITATIPVVERSIKQVERILAVGAHDSPLVTGIAAKDLRLRTLRDDVAALLADQVLPAYQRYRDALIDYRRSAATGFGLCWLPGGEQMYRAAARAWTSLDLDPEQVHAEGRELLAALRAQRGALGPAPVPPIRAGNEIEQLARQYVQRAQEAVPLWFDIDAPPCEVRPIDGYRSAADTSPGYYHPPTDDGSRPGAFHVNTGNPHVVARLAAVAFHETLPGHHLQHVAERERHRRNPDLPSIRRFGGVFAGSAASEGWGLYAERLADEMGLYHEPWERAGMIDAQAWRAVRLVVDTGIHAFGWDRDRAVRELRMAGLDQGTADIEADRYAALPGQALAYALGADRIRRWRDRFVRETGGDAAVRGFHSRVLELGALPLEVLESELFGRS